MRNDFLGKCKSMMGNSTFLNASQMESTSKLKPNIIFQSIEDVMLLIARKSPEAQLCIGKAIAESNAGGWLTELGPVLGWINNEKSIEQ